ncbi:hypothetical protein V6U90_19605 [Micromonospora sp. CPCC 206060]|uniref:hypothetical protein n=1 Tax=Micromonospora sp. CPCC 206060 TaxID=3122406 RepID=UPI002FEF0F11
MRTMGAALTGRLARLALLAATLFGLAMMHSLGHGGGPHPVAMSADPHAMAMAMTSEPHPAAAADQPAMAADPHVAVPAAGPVPAAAGRHATDRPGGHLPVASPADGGRGGHPSGWSVCAAVLGAFAAVALLAVLLLAALVGPGAGPSGRTLPAGSRAPPPAGPIGLTLARVSVRRR